MKKLLLLTAFLFLLLCCSTKRNEKQIILQRNVGARINDSIEEESSSGKIAILEVEEPTLFNKEDSVRKILGITDSIKVLEFDPGNERYGSNYIYIVYNKNSKYYDELELRDIIYKYQEPFMKWQQDRVNYATSDSLRNLINMKYSDLLGRWNQLYMIDRELYVSDLCEFQGYLNLSDTSLYNGYDMDGPWICSIESIYKVSDNHTRFIAKSFIDDKLQTVDFYKYDNKGGYLIKTSMNFEVILGVQDKNIRNYNLVKQNCEDLMVDYPFFEEIDYKQILNNIKEDYGN